jgi:hypothetical protein
MISEKVGDVIVERTCLIALIVRTRFCELDISEPKSSRDRRAALHDKSQSWGNADKIPSARGLENAFMDQKPL